ncbi:zinc finger, PHD-type containing protein [Tanacetum coccineum]
MSRWKDSNTPGKKVPKKVLRYFPIIPRLQRLYKSSHATKMTWHVTGKCTEPGKMQHPVDSRAWKNFDTKYLDFAKEPRNENPGVETIDVATGQKFNIRAMVLWTINDFPARSSLSG